jgi:hypothetical protein
MTTFKRLLLLAPLALLLLPSLAWAEEAAPQWTVSSVSRPTVFAVGASEDSYSMLITNTGSGPADCTEGRYTLEKEEEERIFFEHRTLEAYNKQPICPVGSPAVSTVRITDELPAGVELNGPVSARNEFDAEAGGPGRSAEESFGGDCSATGSGGVSCEYSGLVPVDGALIVSIPVKVDAGASASVRNVVRVAGGGASGAAVMETPTDIAPDEAAAKAQTPFGVAAGGATTTISSVQAGAHADLTTTGAFDTLNGVSGATAGSAKEIVDDLPAGFAGDLRDTPVCSARLWDEEECPIPTQIGVTTQITDFGGDPINYVRPVYNLAAEPGDVAKIGFSIGEAHRYEGNVAVRAPGQACPAGALTACEPYGLQTTFYNVTGSIIDYDGFSLTIWGVPASAVHNPLRYNPAGGDYSAGVRGFARGAWGAVDPGGEVPYLSNPTSCGSASLSAELLVSSWEEREPGAAPSPAPTSMPFAPIVGCDRLLMEPSLSAEVTSDAAYSATGFDLDTSIPQTYPNPTLVTSTLKQEVVTLPEGMTVNPSSGAGLSACSEAQYAEELAPEKTAQEKEEGKGCPNSSKLATVRIKTPSIEEEVTGSAYLADPAPRGEAGKNPFNSLIVLYLVARAKDRGVLVKAPGRVEPNEVTGRLTTTFGAAPAFGGLPASPGLPPLPASDIVFEFNQGANAPLVSPPTCGDYTVTAELTPWSNPEGSPLDPSIRAFPIFADCPAGNVPPFNPGVTAYPVHGNAGAYSPLYIKITRQDGEQEITGFSTRFPPGLTGNLSGVTECGEAEVQHARAQTGVEAEASPACPQNSEIGSSIAEAGVGSVLAQTPGKIYLGGPYDGAPFSVVSVTAAHVGPFDLGTVVIHFPLDIDPETAVVTIPASPADVIPHIIKGIVVHVRSVRVYVTRNDFMLNPTSCNPRTLSATVLGNGPTGNTVTVGDPFQVADCSSLRFEPKFKVSTSAKTSRVDGASLHVALTYPAGALGQDANVKEVKVDLPKQLPSRLPTLQKACTEAQFTANPAGCPAASRIGSATAVTPILPVPLTGPAYFVSNGGSRWPELVMVLQGDGVTIDLHGETFISKQGVTSSTFPAVPDQPVSSFELTLPEGQYSALAALGNLCASKLTMPTEFTGQNGDVIHQTTPVAVTGCAKTKHTKHKRKKHAIKRHARKRSRRRGG